jgi:hypothetical protein
VVERIEFWKASRWAWMGYGRYQVPVGFLGAGVVAWPLRVSPVTEPAAAIREVI